MIKLASAVTPVLLNATQLASETSVAQSFFWEAFDQYWYVCQRDVTPEDQDRLLVTRLTAGGGVVDSMHVERAGHGANIGVERTGGGIFLWTDALPVGGWASAVARMPYVPGGTVDASDTSAPAADVTFHKPRTTGAYRVSATIDPTRRELIYRWQSNNIASESAVGGIDRYDLDTAVAGTYTPLATLPYTASGRTLQGYASLGDYLYTLYGQTAGECRVTCAHWNTGVVVQDEVVTAFSSIANREPEGLCVYENSPGAPQATLALGFAGGVSGARRFHAARFPHPGTSPWVEVAYDTAVFAPNSASYAPQYRLSGDQVHLHFSMDRVDKLAWADVTKLFQLPLPARPNRTQRLVGVVSGAYVTGQAATIRLEVTTDGWVTLFDDRGFKGWIGADVSFWTC
ncbi:hypothetical protein ACFWVF_16485 [Streptomyces sp. NPDC058659]|uniref:phage baseplate protein n=1 Tax=unclassified Streptomyces TaxID=2593676 RepID=UPI00366132B4